MRIERELMRGAGPVAVLKLLEQREMYGYELVDALTKRTDGVLALGQATLYPMLYNLEAKGWLAASERTAPSGRQRKYYRLTDEGRAQLVQQTEQWEGLARAMQSLGILPQPQARMEGLQ